MFPNIGPTTLGALSIPESVRAVHEALSHGEALGRRQAQHPEDEGVVRSGAEWSRGRFRLWGRLLANRFPAHGAMVQQPVRLRPEDGKGEPARPARPPARPALPSLFWTN